MYRFTDAVRRLMKWAQNSDSVYMLLLALFSVVMYFPILFQAKMISGDERVDGYYQYSLFFSRAIENGESFLWNPHSYGGFPTFIDQFGAFLFPPVYLLFKLLPAIFAFNVTIALATFGGLVFAYLFGRSFFLSRPASLILAISYCVAQLPNTFHLGLSYAHSFLVLPMLLLALVGAKRATTRLSFVLYTFLGCAAIATGFLAGYFVTFVYALVFAGLFALFVDVWSESLGFRKGVHASAALAGMFVVGLVVGLPQLIPLLAYGPYTSRTAEFAHEMAVGSGVQLLDFLRLVLPYHFQYPLDPGKGYLYLGFVPLVCVLVALRFFRAHIVRFFAALFLFFLGFALNAPLFAWINIHVPPFNHIGGVSRWLLVGIFALAYLAGYGFDRLHEIRTDARFVSIWRVAQPILMAGVGILVLMQFGIRYVLGAEWLHRRIFEALLSLKGRSIESLRNSPDVYINAIKHELESLNHTFSFANSDFTIFIVLTIVAIYLLRVYIRTGNAWSSTGLVVVSCLTFLSAFVSGLGNTVATSTYFAEEPVAVRTVKVREKHLSEFRFISFTGGKLSRDVRAAKEWPTPEDTTQYMRETLYRETASAYGLRNISGFEPIRSQRANQLIDTVLAPLTDTAVDLDAIRSGAPIDKYVNTDILKQVSEDEKAADIISRLPLLSMMNVKYIVSLYPLRYKTLEELQLQSVPGLLVDPYLYVNKAVLPRIYVATYPEIWRGSERDLFIEMLTTKDFARKTFIECSDCREAQSSGAVGVTHEENGLLHATTTSATGGWLVFSESNLPGWIATIDGERVPIRTANYLFQAIEVPRGVHEINFSYVGSFALFLEKIGLRNL